MNTRRFPGQRAVRICIRTTHIGCVALLLGAATYGAETDLWAHLAVVTGLGLVAEELYRYGARWFRWLQAWVVMAKIAALVAGLAVPALLLPGLWASLVLGGLISHAPGRIRQHPLWGPPGPCALPKEPCGPAERPVPPPT